MIGEWEKGKKREYDIKSYSETETKREGNWTENIMSKKRLLLFIVVAAIKSIIVCLTMQSVTWDINRACSDA